MLRNGATSSVGAQFSIENRDQPVCLSGSLAQCGFECCVEARHERSQFWRASFEGRLDAQRGECFGAYGTHRRDDAAIEQSGKSVR